MKLRQFGKCRAQIGIPTIFKMLASGSATENGANFEATINGRGDGPRLDLVVDPYSRPPRTGSKWSIQHGEVSGGDL